MLDALEARVVVGDGFARSGGWCGFVVVVVGIFGGLVGRLILQMGDLAFDDGHHFDAEIFAGEQGL